MKSTRVPVLMGKVYRESKGVYLVKVWNCPLDPSRFSYSISYGGRVMHMGEFFGFPYDSGSFLSAQEALKAARQFILSDKADERELTPYRPQRPVVPVTNPQEEIPSPFLNPHCSDLRFKEPQTIFLKQGFELSDGWPTGIGFVKGASYKYSDHLFANFSEEKTDEAWEVACGSGHPRNSAAFREVYLRSLLGFPDLELVHIVAEVNRSNGYSVLCYGLKE